ncbi:MAG: CsgG/HfaB family protein [Sedimentisphaerales bacterium]|jgi:curli biogenesis system outer membrane secretion channel CsgG
MKTICAFFAITIVFCSLAFAEDTIVKEVQGQGPSKDDAIKNGLFQAVAQAKGVKVGSGDYSFGYRSASADINRTNTGKTVGFDAVSVQTSGTLQTTDIAGLVKTYEVIGEKKLDDGTYQVTLTVWIYNRVADKTSRTRFAVMPLRPEEQLYSFINLTMPGDQLADKLAQKITTALTQTNKFAVLDRQHIDEYIHEQKVLLYSAPIEEQARIGQVLGADYMLVGTITEANLRIKHSTSEAAAGVNFKEYRADFAFDYRVIVASSRQVKFSDSVRLRLETNEVKQLVTKWEPPDLDYRELVDNLIAKAAAEVVNKLSDRMNPPRIASIEADGKVIIDQGGDRLVTGTLLDVFKTDKQIADADTNEIIGSTETLVATIRIDKVAPVLSYCSMVSGDASQLARGLICRTKSLPAGEPEGMKSNVERTPQGGVILPIDKK